MSTFMANKANIERKWLLRQRLCRSRFFTDMIYAPFRSKSNLFAISVCRVGNRCA